MDLNPDCRIPGVHGGRGYQREAVAEQERQMAEFTTKNKIIGDGVFFLRHVVI